MLRSLFSGISGLRAHQQMLDVTANNIANVNTTGYKASETTFADTLSQTLNGAGAPVGATGGTNPVQIGLGVQLAGTTGNFTEGTPQPTGRNTDLCIDGDGFFVVARNGQAEYTRSGSISKDEAGHLVTPDGAILQGYNYDNTTTPPTKSPLEPIDLSVLGDPASGYVSWNVAANGDINAVDATGKTTTLATVALATFINPEGLLRVGNTAFQATANSGAAQVDAPGSSGHGTLMAGYLEMSNVDLSQELTNLIVAERGFQANSRVITTSDEVLQTLVNLKQ